MSWNLELILDQISPYVYPSTVAVVLTASAIAAWLIYYRVKSTGYPPGPVGIPILGCIPFLGPKLHEEFSRLADRYGDILHVKIGKRDAVVLNSEHMVRAAFEQQGSSFCGRAELPYDLRFLWQDDGVLMSEGEKWTALRKFCVENFDQKRALDGVYTEIMHVVSSLRVDKEQEIRRLLIPAITNVAMMGTLGTRRDYVDQLLQEYSANFRKVADLMGISHICSFLPSALLSVYRGRLAELKTLFKRKLDYIDGFLNLDDTTKLLPDFVSEFLSRGYDQSTKFFNKCQLTMVVDDIWGASTEPTVSTLQWAIYFMIKYPDIQRQVQAELDEQVGDNKRRLITLEDRSLLPMTLATLQETERCGSVAPFAVAHSNPHAENLAGYFIPAKSVVIPNLYHIHHNKHDWDQPETFNPKRFFDGKNVVRPSNLIPFSVGKRACPFQEFASAQLFLFFANLLHRFELGLPSGTQLPNNNNHVNALTIRPQDFSFIATSRISEPPILGVSKAG